MVRSVSQSDLSPHAGRGDFLEAGKVTIALATTLLNPGDLLHNRAPEKSAA
jgi:hypothetical protein